MRCVRRARAHWTATASRPRSGRSPAATRTPRRCTARRSRWNACGGRCSTTRAPGQPVYDPFLGSGTSVIAAETTGRVCLGLELDPAYVDVIVTRWQAFTGGTARLDGAGLTLAEARRQRGIEAEEA